MNATLEHIVSEVLDGLGFDLVETRVGGSRARPTIQVRMDRRDGGKVTVADCTVASRAIERRLDESGAVGERYALEVSSPGVERPLRRTEEWRRFVGRRANVLSAELGGRVEVEIVGVEGDAGNEQVVVRVPNGNEQRIPLAAVKEARLAFNW